MREPRRNPQLPMFLRPEFHAHPCPKSRTAAPHVHGHIKYQAGRYAHQLPLGMRRQLVVQTAEHAASGTRMVVLNEIDFMADCIVEVLAGCSSP